MSDERDTLPPDFRAMDQHALLCYLADSMFEFRQEQHRQADVLKGLQAEFTLLTQHVELIGNQLVTGDDDPQTIAQRLQKVENHVTYLADEKDRVASLRQSGTEIEESGDRISIAGP